MRRGRRGGVCCGFDGGWGVLPVVPATDGTPAARTAHRAGDVGDAARPARAGLPPAYAVAPPAVAPPAVDGTAPAAGALDRVFAIFPAIIRLTCGLAAAATALTVRTPPVSTPLLVVVVTVLTGWSILFAVRTARHGPQTAVAVTDLLLTAGACLLMDRLVAPEVIPGEVSWLAVLASTSVIVAQFSLPVAVSVPAGALVALAYAIGAYRAGNGQEAVGHAGTLLVQTASAAALAYLTRRSSRAADRVFDGYRRSVQQAALARAARAAERRQNRDLHDTVLSTLTVVGLGAVGPRSPWLRERAAADLVALSALAAARSRQADGADRPDIGLTPLDERLRGVLDRFPELPVTCSLAPCAVPTQVADALAGSTAAALSNVVRHAPGANATVRLTETDGTVVVEVADDGPGFDPDQVPLHRYGLRESVLGRMAAHGGRAEIDSAPGRGTRIRLEWPGVH